MASQFEEDKRTLRTRADFTYEEGEEKGSRVNRQERDTKTRLGGELQLV